MKTTLDWYKHDATASESPKFIVLRASPYGWAGEGRFWALNGLIARADGCKLDLTRKFAKAGIADKLDMTVPELEAFLIFLRDECELVEYENGVVATDRTQECLNDVMSERARKANFRGRNPQGGSDKPKLSAENVDISADETHRAEQSRADIEQSRAEAAALHDFALKRAMARGAHNPEAMARTLMGEPDVVAAYKATLPTPDFSTAEPTTPEEVAAASSPEARAAFEDTIDKIMERIGVTQVTEDEF